MPVREDYEHPSLTVRSHHLPLGGGRHAHDETAVQEVLRLLGKADPEGEYNCGACGYHTCREKAAAVVSGRAEPEMCLPYMRTKAESLANVILSSTPNAVILADKDMVVHEWNAAAERMFGIAAHEALHQELGKFLPDEDYRTVLTGRGQVPSKKIAIMPAVVTLFAVAPVKGGELAMGIYTDIARLEEQSQSLLKVRQETVEKAQIEQVGRGTLRRPCTSDPAPGANHHHPRSWFGERGQGQYIIYFYYEDCHLHAPGRRSL